mmetsp:Transcript_8201/g.20186  ORF Transcript_8201/g.20186 Transcript_8201/m.20186 type:complete len:81 (+) Transcript_8201:129-371(+)
MYRFFNGDTNDDDGWRRKVEHRRQKTRPFELFGAGFKLIWERKITSPNLVVLVNELALALDSIDSIETSNSAFDHGLFLI